jgi:pimeloyl-ACP methyl ester carboxylesterase
MYVQDYGAPIGWRLALSDPDAVTAIITQNGNAYEAGFIEEFWRTVWAYQRAQTPETETSIRSALTLDATRWQYLADVPDETLVSPETWEHDYALLSRPGNDQIQLALFRDYATNPPLYPRLHEYLRQRRPPVLAVWGRDDPIFEPDGARAFRAACLLPRTTGRDASSQLDRHACALRSRPPAARSPLWLTGACRAGPMLSGRCWAKTASRSLATVCSPASAPTPRSSAAARSRSAILCQ